MSVIDLLHNAFRSEVFKFEARQNKNFEAYTKYLFKNYCEVAAQIWTVRQKGYCVVGLILET